MILGMMLLLLSAVPVWGAALHVEYLEPAAQGNLAHTTIYWCKGKSCTNWSAGLVVPSDDGFGDDLKETTLLIPVNEPELPVTVRVRVTATDTEANQTRGTIAAYRFRR